MREFGTRYAFLQETAHKSPPGTLAVPRRARVWHLFVLLALAPGRGDDACPNTTMSALAQLMTVRYVRNANRATPTGDPSFVVQQSMPGPVSEEEADPFGGAGDGAEEEEAPAPAAVEEEEEEEGGDVLMDDDDE